MGLLSSKASEINTEQSTVSLAEHMPCEILAHIFSNMSTKDLITSSRVCHRWHNIANDPSLWKHIKLTAHHMTIQQLQRFAKTHFTDRLQTLELKFPTAAGPKLYKPTATFFRSCPNLKRLSLTNADMTVHLPPSVGVLQLSHCSVSASLFTGCHNGTSRLREVKLRAVNLRSGSLAVLPSTVQRLAIHDSKIPCHCLPVANAPNPAAIIEIDLSDNHQIKPEEFSRIMAAWSPIKVLKISRCSFTSVDFFGLNTSHLQGLEALEMNDFAGLINSPIRYICRNGGRNLRRLSIAGCVRASPRAVLNIAEHQTSLQYLDVSRCPRLTDASFFVLFNLRRTLRYLNVANSNASADTVNALRLMMPNCEIVH